MVLRTPLLIGVLAVTAAVTADAQAEGFPKREGINLLIAARDGAELTDEESGKTFVRAQAKKGSLYQFITKAGDRYELKLPGNRVCISAADVDIKQRRRVPDMSDHENTQLDMIDEYLYLAREWETKGEDRKAIPLRGKAVSLATHVLGEDNSFVATQIGKFGAAYHEIGQFAKSDELLTKAYDLLRKPEAKAPPQDVAATLGKLAQVRAQTVGYVAARSLFDEAVQIAEDLPDRGRVLYRVLADFAKVQLAFGYQKESVENYERSLHIISRASLPTMPYFSSVLGDASRALQEQGRLREARVWLEQSLQLKMKIFGTDHPDVAADLVHMASLAFLLGDTKQAIDTNLRAVRIYLTKLSTKHPESIEAISNMADYYYANQDIDRAKVYYARAHEFALDLLGPDDVRTINATADKLRLGVDFDDPKERIARCKELLEQIRQKHGASHPSLLALHTALMQLYADTMQFEELVGAVSATLKYERRQFGNTHPVLAERWSTLANVLAKVGRWDEAVKAASSSRALYEHVAKTLLPNLSDAEQLQFLQPDRDSLHAAISVVLAGKSEQLEIDRCAEWILNGKARAHEALALQTQRLRNVTDKKARRLVGDLRVVRRQLADAAVKKSVALDPEDSARTIEELKLREQALVRELDRRHVEPEEAPQAVTLHDIRRRLPPSGTLVEIIRIEPLDHGPAKPFGARQAPRYVGIVINADKPVDLIDFGLAEQIDASLDSFRGALDKSALLLAVDDEKRAQILTDLPLRRLAKKLYDPLVEHLQGKKRIFLSLDGPLWLVPWENFLIDEKTYAVEKYIFQYVVSGRHLTQHRRPPENISPPAVFADPAYDYLPTQLERMAKAQRANTLKNLIESPRVGRLPGTRAEALVAKPLLEKRFDGEIEVYMDEDATEWRLKKLVNPEVLYLATHGYFSVPPTRENLMSLGFAKKTGSYEAREGNPLLRCGVCLASCNQMGIIRSLGVGAEDGMLTGAEAAGLELRGTELVVLSACETSVGDVRSGEGLADLRHAFHLAGARHVIGTSWAVMDRESAQLMSGFFFFFSRTSDPAEALQQAQNSMIKRLRIDRDGLAHPLLWGAYSISYR